MIRTVTAFCVAAAFGIGSTLWAEAPNSPQAITTAGARDIKVTGCVAKDEKGVLTLTHAVVEPAGGAAAGAKPDPIDTATTFQLDGPGLEAHISHKVEITGSAVPPPAPEASPTTTADAAGRGGGAGRTPTVPRLTAKAVKHIHTYPCF